MVEPTQQRIGVRDMSYITMNVLHTVETVVLVAPTVPGMDVARAVGSYRVCRRYPLRYAVEMAVLARVAVMSDRSNQLVRIG